MKIKINCKEVDIFHNLNCEYFDVCLKNDFEIIELSMFHDIFLDIYNNTLNYEKYDPNYLYSGLCYFGSYSLENFLTFLGDKIYKKEKESIQKSIVDLFEFLQTETEYCPTYLQNPSLPEEYLEYVIENKKVQFEFIANNKSLSENFVLKYKEQLNPYVEFLCKNHNLSIPFLEEHFHITRRCLNTLSNRKLDEEFIDKNINNLDWSELSKHLSLSQIHKYINRIDWTTVWVNPNIDDNFIETFKKRIHKYFLAYNENITEHNIVKYNLFSDLCFNDIDYKNISNDFINNNTEKFNFQMGLLYRENINTKYTLESKNIMYTLATQSFLKKSDMVDHIYKMFETKTDINSGELYMISQNRYLDPQFFKKYYKHFGPLYIYANDFNLPYKISQKIKNTVYFDKQLDSHVKQILKIKMNI